MCSLDPYKLHIKDIRIVSCSISSDTMSSEEKMDISFDLSHDYGINETDRLVKSVIDIGVRVKRGEEKEQNEAKYKIALVYMVDNLNDFIKNTKNNEKQLDALLITTLASITYSTARGIIYQHAKGLWLEHVVLPIVKPVDLFSDDVIRPASG